VDRGGAREAGAEDERRGEDGSGEEAKRHGMLLDR
jgi:hypothetical protein